MQTLYLQTANMQPNIKHFVPVSCHFIHRNRGNVNGIMTVAYLHPRWFFSVAHH